MNRSGFTLIELVATIAILGIIAGVTGLALARAEPVPTANTETVQITSLRRESLRHRKAVSTAVRVNRQLHLVTAMPDGRIVSDSVIVGYRLTGYPCDQEKASACSK